MDKLPTKLIRHSDDWTLELSGNVDANTAHLMWIAESGEPLLKEMTQAQVKRLIVDLTEVEFIDSHGLRNLLNAHRDFSGQNIQIVLQNPNSHLKRLLRIMQFDRVFIIEPKE